MLMEGVPLHLQLDAVGRDLTSLDGVLRVHDLHVWTLSSGAIALSAHLETRNLADWPDLLAAARQTMNTTFAMSRSNLKCWPRSRWYTASIPRRYADSFFRYKRAPALDMQIRIVIIRKIKSRP